MPGALVTIDLGSSTKASAFLLTCSGDQGCYTTDLGRYLGLVVCLSHMNDTRRLGQNTNNQSIPTCT